MFCPKCGKAEQISNSYCRNCGEFLVDSSEKFSLLYKLFGINTPEKQINANILFNLAGAALSFLLLGFLMGYFDAQENKNPAVGTPTIIYLVYAFLVFISAWQFLGFIMNLKLKSKFAGRDKNQTRTDSFTRENEMTSAETQELLPEADFSNMVTTSVTENTTKTLTGKNKTNSPQTEQ